MIGISLVGSRKGLQTRNNLCKRPAGRRFIVRIERKPRGRTWILRLSEREGPDYMRLCRSFLDLYLKIKGRLLDSFKNKSKMLKLAL